VTVAFRTLAEALRQHHEVPKTEILSFGKPASMQRAEQGF